VPQFKEVIREEKNRNISTVLPNGSVEPQVPSFEKPIVILIPGIMGSNLYEGDSEIWINYRRMAFGSLADLFIESDKITAKSLVGSAYARIVEDLSEKYDVVVFPYDWRKSLTEAGKNLADQIETELLPQLVGGKTLQIIAHSMGGLVVRDVMMHHGSTWEKLNQRSGFRCLLLGTPWQGSYLIPEIITGIGSRIKSISRLALFQSRQELLGIFVKYPGLLELLPIYEEAHEFENRQLWEALQKTTKASLWELPEQQDLDNFKAYKDQVRRFDDWKLDKVYYIAGQADTTFSNFVCKDYLGTTLNGYDLPRFLEQVSNRNLFTRFQLFFTGTPRGDGSVTWEHGIPPQLQAHQVFYMPTVHGELANDSHYFEAIRDILATGSTATLSKTPPTTRAMAQAVFVENKEVFTNDVNILGKQILGLNTKEIYQSKAKYQKAPIRVTVKNGHLRYSKFPLMVGHFKDDGIVSAEYVVDYLLKRKLSQREAIGLYPGPIGTNLVHLPDKKNDLGAVVVGLGAVEQLTPFLLSRTIELGCLEYILSVNKNGEKKQGDYVGISTLLIGSRYANLSLTNSINAILEGIINANKKIHQMNKAKSNLPSIAEIEFVELYKDRADDTFYQLHQINHNNSFYNIDLEYPINEVDGARSYLPLSDEKEWWKRITAVIKEDPVKQTKYMGFSSSTGRAVVEKRESFANLQIIDALLADNKKQTNWDRELTKTIFELLIPNDFKISFRNQQNILLILDKTTASFPWELLNYDEKLTLPIVVSAGMIRQLATRDDRRKIKPVNNKKALIIGDPVLDQTSGIPQLPEARVEAQIVDNLLNQHNYDTTTKINEPFKEIFKKLYDEYKIIHIASHGVIDYGEDKKTGILLSNNIVLTAAEIDQISSTPELVFINSCYMGQVNPEQEAHFRSKYKLAANIGVQFIENGVKAVVVAGWAVNDAAAKRFAQVFYEAMLRGEMFAEAVKAARSACFREFPNTNTWGAYQCYGDQFYTLQRKRWDTQNEEPYILEKEILIDLENVIDDSKSSRKRERDFVADLGIISKRIDASGLRNAIVSEIEIQAYLELGVYDIAFEKYDQLFQEQRADYSVRTLEQWCSNKMKHLQDIYDNEMKAKGSLSRKTAKMIRDTIKLILSRMNDLLRLGPTAERHFIMAGIQKRRSMITASDKDKKDALRQAAVQYKKGYALSQDIYPLTSWIITERIINDPKSIADMNRLLENDPLKFIQKELKKIAENEKDEKEFWDQVRPVNLKQAKLLFLMDDAQEETRRQLAEEIKADYRVAWQLGGASERHRLSEILQMEFIRHSLKFMEETKPENERRNIEGIVDVLNELIEFFEELR
ncbi:MAG: CHAT domain-containing protein, partial [Bacteroidota bacterium]